MVTQTPDYVPAYVQLGQLLTRLEREDEREKHHFFLAVTVFGADCE